MDAIASSSIASLGGREVLQFARVLTGEGGRVGVDTAKKEVFVEVARGFLVETTTRSESYDAGLDTSEMLA